MQILRMVLLLSLIATPCLAQEMYAKMNPYVAGSVAATAADYTPAYAKVCLSDAEGAGTAFKVKIYNSNGTALTNGESAEGSWSSGGPKWSSNLAFTSAAALTAGNTYYIAYFANGTVYLEGHSTGWHHLSVGSLTYGTFPSTITPGSDSAVDAAHIGVGVYNASNVLLIGDETCSAGDNKSIGATSIMYFDDGFVCVTQ